MASPVPAKSQPLHNFSLPHHLTWKKSHTSTTTSAAADHQQRARTRLSTPPPPPPSNTRRSSPHFDPPRRQSSPSNASRRQPSPSYASRRHSPLLESLSKQSPLRESESESDFRRQRSPSCASRRQTSPSCAGRRHSPLLDSTTSKLSPMRDSESESDFTSAAHKASAAPEHSRSDLPVLPSDKTKSTDTNPKFVLANDKGKRSKIYIRFRKNKLDETIPDEDQDKSGAVEGDGGAVAEDEESMPKTWNLRPRRPLNKQSNVNGNGGVHKIGGSILQENKSLDKNQLEGNNTMEKKEKKQEFSISLFLSRDEIEEDIYALTGTKPSRRPRKRHKTVQRQIESMLPGFWLSTITTDSYKVSEAPAKV